MMDYLLLVCFLYFVAAASLVLSAALLVPFKFEITEQHWLLESTATNMQKPERFRRRR